MTITEMVEFLESWDGIDDTPWMLWGDERFCRNCEPITIAASTSHVEMLAAPCEVGECPKGMGMNENWCLEWLESESAV
jgi:hypothetical protein